MPFANGERSRGHGVPAFVLAPPAGERDIVRHYTLTEQDLATIAAKRGDHNRTRSRKLAPSR